VPSYVSGAILTRDPIQARLYDNDRSITRDISARVLLELRREAEKLIDRACSISAPTLLIIPEQDYIVTRREQMEFYSRLRSTKKQLITFKGMRHDVIHDIEKEKALWAVRDFALENFDAMSS
jgi:alpha-beta hydrolase superfamily lysophospholipase